MISPSPHESKYETIMLLSALYGFETWCLTLRKECRLRVFETGFRSEDEMKNSKRGLEYKVKGKINFRWEDITWRNAKSWSDEFSGIEAHDEGS